MRYRKLTLTVLLLSAAVFISGLVYAGEFMAPTKEDKCPVCGMFVHKYPKWIAEITFKDGTYAVFDGPKDMLKYYFNVSKYNKKKTKADIADVYVTEYYTTKHVRAEDVFFVTGSDVYGPMGVELVPVKGTKEAHAFMKDHQGQKMLRLSEITPADLPGVIHKHHKKSGSEENESHEMKSH